jgi:hypothetical protein
VWDIAFRLLLVTVIGDLAPDDFLSANQNVHRRLAHSRRRRKPHVSYPFRR